LRNIEICRNYRQVQENFMKKLLIGAALAVASLSASAQVSISIGQPGFYGRVDLGSYAPPPVVYGPPVLASGGYYNGAPVYLRAPLNHRRNWSRYCNRYNACGQRVLFVRDDWYVNNYAPRYREYYGRGGPGWRDHGRHEFHDNRGHGRGPDRGHGWDDNRGHGGGHGGGRGGDHGGGRGNGGDHDRGNHGGGEHHGGGDRGR
jgi:hypothetical protein